MAYLLATFPLHTFKTSKTLTRMIQHLSELCRFLLNAQWSWSGHNRSQAQGRPSSLSNYGPRGTHRWHCLGVWCLQRPLLWLELLAVVKVKILREGGKDTEGEPELGPIQPKMAQKPVLRGEVGPRALRMRSVSREEAWASAGVQGAWMSGCVMCEAG